MSEIGARPLGAVPVGGGRPASPPAKGCRMTRPGLPDVSSPKLTTRRLQRVTNLAVAVWLFAGVAQAAPPAEGSEDWNILAPHADWVRRLRLGIASCCDLADGRPVDARTRGDRWQVRWRPGQLEGAPTGWTDVPPAVLLRVANPTGFPIAFWHAGAVRCFVPPGGI